jgi:sulfur-oxidizing protein SoxY
MQGHLCTRRRRLLQGAGALAALGLAGLPAARAAVVGPAGLADAFAAKTFAEAMAALDAAPAPDGRLTLVAPTIAENGAVVPITVSSALPGTREIVLLVDCNPLPVAVQFGFPAGTEPFVATRIRMAASGTVVAAVLTDHGVYATSRAIEVTVGGCG